MKKKITIEVTIVVNKECCGDCSFFERIWGDDHRCVLFQKQLKTITPLKNPKIRMSKRCSKCLKTN